MFAEPGFLYETLTGKPLHADDVSLTGYINILDPKLHVTGPVRRVRDNELTITCSETIPTVHGFVELMPSTKRWPQLGPGGQVAI
jgi:hypothetical protein